MMLYFIEPAVSQTLDAEFLAAAVVMAQEALKRNV